ncbi:MAG: DUF4276 family protein [Planctomycetes bacterium]|nr:DUF4276 family protein [Planctomycetota bacterium]MBI3834294.1 DUF4276 family protein [Planctomycetota bacterium]
MKIVVICEGATEAALKSGLRELVQTRSISARRVGIDTRSLDGPTIRKKLGRVASNLLVEGDVVGVIALSDVHPNYRNASETKEALRHYAAEAATHPRFRAHAAQFEFEAWLLPHWDEITKSLKVNAAKPGANPEQVNGQSPPSHRLKGLYQRARRKYDKVVDALRWLTAERLEQSAKECPQLKEFLDSLLEFASTAQTE